MATDGWGDEVDEYGRVIEDPGEAYGEFLFFLDAEISEVSKRGYSSNAYKLLVEARALLFDEFKVRHPKHANKRLSRFV